LIKTSALFIAVIAVPNISAAPVASETPSIGAEVTNVSRAYRAEHQIPDYVDGALVRAVRPGSPAAKAGIVPGDVVQGIDRDLIQSACDFTSRLKCTESRLTIRRGTETRHVTVRAVDVSMLPASTQDVQRDCQSGNGTACTALAKQTGETVDLLRLACNLGDAEGCYVLGLKLRDDKEVAGAYEQACNGGYSQACTNLGWMYENARGVNEDLGASVRLYKRGCDGSPCSAPNNLGCVNLAKAFRAGRGTEKNDVVATRLFRDVCRRTPVPGSSEDAGTIARACSLAGTALVLGQGILASPDEGLRLLEKGCSVDDTFGCYNLGAFYETGTGVGADRNRAITYYQRACDHGDTEACDRLTRLTK